MHRLLARLGSVAGAPGPSSRLLLLAASAVLASGCTTLFEGKYDFREGWRRGEVLRIMDGGAIERPRYWRCSRRATAEELAGGRYAVLAYDEVPYRARRYLVAVPAGMELQAGQHVYVNVYQCDHAIALPGASKEEASARRSG